MDEGVGGKVKETVVVEGSKEAKGLGYGVEKSGI